MLYQVRIVEGKHVLVPFLEKDIKPLPEGWPKIDGLVIDDKRMQHGVHPYSVIIASDLEDWGMRRALGALSVRLPPGIADYIARPNDTLIFFEVKTVRDFVQSFLRSDTHNLGYSRLQEQVKTGVEIAHVFYLVVIGIALPSSKSLALQSGGSIIPGIDYIAYEKAKSRLGRYGVHVVHAPNREVACDMIKRLAGTTRQEDTFSQPRLSIPSKESREVIALAYLVPRLGIERAKRVLETYGGSIAKLAQATEEELKSIEGIGEKLAKNIVIRLRGELYGKD